MHDRLSRKGYVQGHMTFLNFGKYVVISLESVAG